MNCRAHLHSQGPHKALNLFKLISVGILYLRGGNSVAQVETASSEAWKQGGPWPKAPYKAIRKPILHTGAFKRTQAQV